jgi:LPXTG-motif cell wall-anchored protein
VQLRVGGVLSLVLGGVLVTGGAFGLDTGAGTPAPSCGGIAPGATPPACPLGVLHLSETTTGSGTPPVGGWQVDITSSNCTFPGTSATTLTVAVPDNGSVDSPQLYQNTDGPETTPCSYTVTQQAVAGFTTTYDPDAPYELPQLEDNSAVTDVGIMNDSPVVASPSPTPTEVPTPEPTLESTAIPLTSGDGGGAGALPSTGSRHARAELAGGVALLLLGAFLLLAGRRPQQD